VKIRVQRWGDSLAVRIPAALANQLRISENTPVGLEMVDRVLILRAGSEPTLEQVLAGITDENIPREIDAGPSLGVEVW